MDLGTAPLFDLTAPVADEAVKAAAAGTADEVPLTRSQELLAQIRDDQAAITDREISKVRRIAEWAAEHTVELPEDASTITERGLDTGLPIAGDGAPLISDFALMELAAVLGRSLDSGRAYVGEVVELAYRLPRIWQRVLDGQVPVWKALRIADHTRTLNQEAAEFVDRQLAPFAAGCTWAQIDRLVDEALTRFDPEAAEAKRKAAAENRRFDIHLNHAGTGGTVPVDGHLDLADALDVEQAIRDRARQLGSLGSKESLDVRRAMALGEMARDDLTLDLNTGEITDRTADQTVGEVGQDAPDKGGFEARKLAPQPPTRRKVELFLHLTDAAIAGGVADGSLGRVANTQSPVTAEQIKQWCATAGIIVVRPVIDIAGHEPIGAYEIPDRHRQQVLLREEFCVFPGCTKRAEHCDLDHAESYAEGGETCPCNLSPLCRGHHRLKTHGGWTYVVLDPGAYLWTSPNGYQWVVDHHGTRSLGFEARCGSRYTASSLGGTRPPSDRTSTSGSSTDPPDE